jgi:DNA-binding MarR family transcriptional regulator
MDWGTLANKTLARLIADELPRGQRRILAEDLAVLLALHDEPLTVKQLMTTLGMGVSLVSPIVARLEQMGLVTKYENTNDGRSVFVGVTARALQQARRARGRRGDGDDEAFDADEEIEADEAEIEEDA